MAEVGRQIGKQDAGGKCDDGGGIGSCKEAQRAPHSSWR